MAIELVTGYQGQDHVTAEQWADFNRGIFGDAAILPIGNRMETAIQTANQISVKDGVAVFDGRQVYIGYGESENIAITSGTQGMLRRDIVVVEYTREEDTGIESVQFKVINGTPAANNAQDPTVQDMDIRTGVFVSQKPFCRVRLNGTAIEGVDSLVQVKEFKDHAFSDPVNALTGTNPLLSLAAPQGRALDQKIAAINSALEDNFNQNRVELTNSSFYPTAVCYRSGQMVYMKCAGTLEKEIPADTPYVIGVESMMPEKYRPNANIVAYPNISLGGKQIKLEIMTTGRVIFTSPEKLPVGFGLNMHFVYATGKSNF